MKAVILVGGEGTRMRPLTLNRPKPMVPVLNRPFLERMITYLKKHGIDDIILALCYLPDHIEGHFGDGGRLGVHLTYVTEDVPLGTAGAVKNVERYLEETFFVFNGDIFTDLDLTEMMELHRERKAKVTIALTPVENPSDYGVVETEPDGRVKRFIEKPRPGTVTSNMINAGTYIIEPEALGSIAGGCFCMFERELFPGLVDTGERVYSHRSSAYWMDIGTPVKYLQLHHELLQKQAAGAFLEEEIWSEAYCDIHPAAEIQGPVLIGRDCVIGPGVTVLGPCVVGPGCEVGADSVIDRAVIWQNTRVGRGVRARGCVIAENVILGDRSQIMERCVLGDNVVVGEGETVEQDAKLVARSPSH